jgi:hypothetical protein
MKKFDLYTFIPLLALMERHTQHYEESQGAYIETP